jgi:predicted phage-related endonuclease
MTREPLPGEGEFFEVESHANREAWLAARTVSIGGSEAPSLWSAEIAEWDGQAPHSSQYALWALKAGLLPEQKPAPVVAVTFDPFAAASGELELTPIDSGNLAEDDIRETFATRTGARIAYPGAFTVLRSLHHPGLSVSLDGAILAATTGALECKDRDSWALPKWRDGLPLVVQVQIAHALLVTGWTWGVGIARTGRYRMPWHRYDRDEDFMAAHLSACDEFLKRVRDRDPPPVDGHPSTTRTLLKLHPKDSGKTISAGTTIVEATERWESARKTQKEQAEVEEFAENVILAEMRDATWATLPDGRSFQLRTEGRKPRLCKCGEQVQAGWEKRVPRIVGPKKK